MNPADTVYMVYVYIIIYNIHIGVYTRIYIYIYIYVKVHLCIRVFLVRVMSIKINSWMFLVTVVFV